MVYLNSSVSILFVVLAAVSGCFITNCPPGGKRSGVTDVKVRQCEQCGPPGSNGRCFGPTICCSPEFGCLISTPETIPCLVENRFTTLCQNPGSSCAGPNGDLNSGQCGADGVCCNSETCMMDESCRDDSSNSLVGKETTGAAVKTGKYNHHRYPLDIVFHRYIQNQNSHRRLPSSSNSQQSTALSSASATDY